MKKFYLLLACTVIFCFASNAQVVINELYGGGGNSGATYKNDFIELYNNGSSAVSLAGWSVQYASAAGTTWAVTNLSGSIPVHGYYLIREAVGSGGTTNLPTPDAIGSIAMSATAGKVILCNTTTAQTGSNPSGAQIIDKVGFGSTANSFEGSGPTPAPSNTTSVQRTPEGFDSNNNNSDFTVGSPSPTNSTGGVDLTSPTISSLFPSNSGTNVITSFTASITFSETIQKGASGTITVKKLSDNSIVQTTNIMNATVTVSGSNVSFDVSSLDFSTAYYIEISSGSFKDLSNNDFAGTSGSGSWSFTTAATSPTGIIGSIYNFNTCGSNLADGFTQYNVLGDQKWGCTSFGVDALHTTTGSAANGLQINGFLGTNIPNQDWLITPAFDLSSTIYPLLSFWSRTAFNGSPLQLKVSTDYPGTGDPRVFTWTDLNGKFPNQTSDVWTLSNNINLSAFKSTHTFIAFVYTSTNEDGARWTIDDVTLANSLTPPPPSLTTSATDIQFTYVASGSNATKTFNFTGNDLTDDVTVTSTGAFEVSKDGVSFSPSITYSVAEANNENETVYVRFSPTQQNRDYSGTITVATSTLSDDVNLKGTSIDPATTLEVVNWNLEWFGSTTLGPTNDNLQEQNVKSVLQNVGADIYGLLEVVDESRLANIVSQMPGYTYVVGQYGSHVNPPDPSGGPLSEAQKLAFVYKTSVFSNVSVRPLINNQNTSSTSYNNWSSGRYPLLMTADVTLNCITKKINFILVHAKANTSPTATSYARRQAAAAELHDTIQTYFAEQNVIVLGDFNDDLDQTITSGINPPTTSYSSFTTDNANFFSPTLALSLAGKKSTVSYNDVIDHVMLSNEMETYYMPSTATVLSEVSSLISNYGSTTTDHYPVFTRYKFEAPAPPVVKTCPTVSAFCANTNGTYTIPVFEATSPCGFVNYSYTITGATNRSGTTNDASGSFEIGTSIITWVASDAAGDSATCQTTVVVNANPVVTIPDAYALSSGVLANTVYIGYTPASSITLSSTVTGGSPNYSYSWSNGSLTSSAMVSPTSNTTYSLTVTDANGCQGTATKNISVLDIRAGKKMDKINICHVSGNTHSIQIDPSAAPAHLAHGDMLGSCEIVSPAITSRYQTQTEIVADLQVKVLSNPSSNYFVLKLTGGNTAEKINIRITDVIGRTVEVKNSLSSNQNVMLGNSYQHGVYFAEVIQGRVRKQIKLIKQ
jgi:hypothetical protein